MRDIQEAALMEWFGIPPESQKSYVRHLKEHEEYILKEKQMSKIPPREWPVYDPASKCSACGSTETEDHDSSQFPYLLADGPHIRRDCENCSMVRCERPLDFDFEAWREVWDIEEKIDALKGELKRAREKIDAT
jgi:hypothetical protein